MSKTLMTMPTPTKRRPGTLEAYYTLNLTRREPNLNSLRILRRVWDGSEQDELAFNYNNIFTSVESAKAARADIFKALANHD